MIPVARIMFPRDSQAPRQEERACRGPPVSCQDGSSAFLDLSFLTCEMGTPTQHPLTVLYK